MAAEWDQRSEVAAVSEIGDGNFQSDHSVKSRATAIFTMSIYCPVAKWVG
jgi:hypothetical protein